MEAKSGLKVAFMDASLLEQAWDAGRICAGGGGHGWLEAGRLGEG